VLPLNQELLFAVGGLIGGALLMAVAAWIRGKQRHEQIESAKNTAARIIEEA
jgi:hypothetical protein